MTKSALFKQAHALAKATIKAGDNYQATFALCLKAVIADTKAPKATNELPALVGTDKQVAWADKIRKDNLFDLNRLHTFFANSVERATNTESDNYKLCAKVVDVLAQLRQNDQASFWIDNGKMQHGETLFDGLGMAVLQVHPKNKMVKTIQTLKHHGYIA